jgi:hypothetical protein
MKMGREAEWSANKVVDDNALLVLIRVKTEIRTSDNKDRLRRLLAGYKKANSTWTAYVPVKWKVVEGF